MRAIHGDEAGLANETIVPRLEAVLGVCIQRKGDGQIVEDVCDLVQRGDCECAAVEEVAVGT